MCIFCEIASGNIPSYKVYEDENVLAFLDLSQATIGHTLVIPKKHFDDILSLDEETSKQVFAAVNKITKHLSKVLNINNFNILNNCGEIAGQTVHHFHIHIIPRYDSKDLEIKFNSNKLDENEFKALLDKIKL